MNTILYDLDVDYEVVSNHIDFHGINETHVKEESEASSKANTFVPKHEEIKTEKIAYKKSALNVEEINLDDSFFEPQI